MLSQMRHYSTIVRFPPHTSSNFVVIPRVSSEVIRCVCRLFQFFYFSHGNRFKRAKYVEFLAVMKIILQSRDRGISFRGAFFFCLFATCIFFSTLLESF
jgi:hypothetical protein